jgi:hypothetical protein
MLEVRFKKKFFACIICKVNISRANINWNLLKCNQGHMEDRNISVGF